MASPRISLLKSQAVGVQPTASAMASGELAVNYADKKIYGKHPGSGAVVQVAASPIHTHALSDLTQSGATSGQVPTWNGTAWAPQTPSGGTPAPTNDLDEMFNTASATYYHEVNYTAGGDVSAIQVYATSAKTMHLYSRSFTYDGAGNLTQVVTTDQQNAGVSLTKNITYTQEGNINTVTRIYSP